MKKIVLYTMTALAIAVMATVSCKKPQEPSKPGGEQSGEVHGGQTQDGTDAGKVAAFCELSGIGIYAADMSGVFLMDKESHDIVLEVAKSLFTLRDGTFAVLYSVKLSSEGQAEGWYSAEVASSLPDFASRTARMKEVKRSGDLLWLWEENNGFGLVIMAHNLSSEEIKPYESQMLELRVRSARERYSPVAELEEITVDETAW